MGGGGGGGDEGEGMEAREWEGVDGVYGWGMSGVVGEVILGTRLSAGNGFLGS